MREASSRPPVLWGLAAWGAPGVQRLLELMQSELALAMGLAGQASVAELSRDLVKLHRW
ncbi:MAG: alpha-hydroxy-acid oxidizing protein [Bryobacterales bacterium]